MGDTRKRIVKHGLVTPALYDADGNEVTIAQLLTAGGFTQAAFVADADDTSLATLKTSIDNLKNSLVAAGLMAAS